MLFYKISNFELLKTFKALRRIASAPTMSVIRCRLLIFQHVLKLLFDSHVNFHLIFLHAVSFNISHFPSPRIVCAKGVSSKPRTLPNQQHHVFPAPQPAQGQLALFSSRINFQWKILFWLWFTVAEGKNTSHVC